MHPGLDRFEVNDRLVVGDGRAARNVVDLDFLHAGKTRELLLHALRAQR
jgi:hypothetical protein